MHDLHPGLSRAAWATTLQNDFDRKFLMEGFSAGFRVVPEGETIKPARVGNYRSCYTEFAKPRINDQIRHELLTGRYIHVDLSIPVHVHVIAAIPKKNSTKICIITDCSKPTNASLNDHITAPSFKYVTIDSAMKLMSQGSWMSILDITEAFHQVPIHLLQHKLFGIH